MKEKSHTGFRFSLIVLLLAEPLTFEELQETLTYGSLFPFKSFATKSYPRGTTEGENSGELNYPQTCYLEVMDRISNGIKILDARFQVTRVWNFSIKKIEKAILRIRKLPVSFVIWSATRDSTKNLDFRVRFILAGDAFVWILRHSEGIFNYINVSSSHAFVRAYMALVHHSI